VPAGAYLNKSNGYLSLEAFYSAEGQPGGDRSIFVDPEWSERYKSAPDHESTYHLGGFNDFGVSVEAGRDDCEFR
jgi:hypothetical protein